MNKYKLLATLSIVSGVAMYVSNHPEVIETVKGKAQDIYIKNTECTGANYLLDCLGCKHLGEKRRMGKCMGVRYEPRPMHEKKTETQNGKEPEKKVDLNESIITGLDTAYSSATSDLKNDVDNLEKRVKRLEEIIGREKHSTDVQEKLNGLICIPPNYTGTPPNDTGTMIMSSSLNDIRNDIPNASDDTFEGIVVGKEYTIIHTDNLKCVYQLSRDDEGELFDSMNIYYNLNGESYSISIDDVMGCVNVRGVLSNPDELEFIDFTTFCKLPPELAIAIMLTKDMIQIDYRADGFVWKDLYCKLSCGTSGEDNVEN